MAEEEDDGGGRSMIKVTQKGEEGWSRSKRRFNLKRDTLQKPYSRY